MFEEDRGRRSLTADGAASLLDLLPLRLAHVKESLAEVHFVLNYGKSHLAAAWYCLTPVGKGLGNIEINYFSLSLIDTYIHKLTSFSLTASLA